ncbi:transcription elongation factor GreA [Candidatus Roizmanbacteria bacterium RIFOXYB2_FULL_38_10]|uniref:Transcription elongation factor GreA n=1 Tax=Candidatus Roizmanbacteria bacterium RIFOXYD1_FULL_38_12 TaxID=1802093 RepID=A0A1F7L015_9BACT|nr:MAG: transcription elongation factor GreA [Candidatus Roizmanbacteria bacterium RIFOXYA2_FULL_38_14]OGK63445.1 MAG: transcription elongation factor GreA [Candidatus Roizmanbacteria bacterium RIFOXYA1_FULL_37_12]OGK65291.1 MAG: transcription elongation factor GreA [Candidatus Roizmanbacteria bacterium RIFOXYB1_FULL_40_23]OGK67995.1 MAG: transcription elongation factor GreA [Candidatus Roizmanbacteria bacterium RIFOXYB2_FULL_38_10]OGK69696.1 MAG: transcription elongation factor GreA [Candidatu
MTTAKIEITQMGLEKLKAELHRLETIERPLMLEKLHRARSMGDLSENSAYTSAREEQGVVEGRILEIQYILKNAKVVTKTMKNDVIQLGAKIKVHINGKEEDTIEIVGEFESDPMNKKLSATSPIGKALLGKKPGDTVEIIIPSGKIIYKILAIT